MRRILLAMSRSRRLAEYMTSSRLVWLAARRFVAGNTLDDAVAVVGELNAKGMSATLDRLGENVASREEAESARDASIEIVRRIRQAGIHSGLSIKLTSLGLTISTELASEMLREVVTEAAKLDPPVFVRIDMEDSPQVQATLDMFYELFQQYRNVGVVIQSYLYRSASDVERLIELGAGVRMVKGAYLEPPSVAYPDKSDVDAEFIRLCERLFSPEARAKGVYLAVATHDTKLLDWTKAFAEREGVAPDRFEFQFLHGVRRDLQASLVQEGFRMRVYVPYGRQWYPYFMRRLAERPQNVWFLASNVLRELTSRP